MTDEFNALQISYTCTLVPLPQNRIAIRCKWVFRVKENSDGSVNKYKDRLVAKGFNQQFGFDFHETFSRYQTCHYKGHSHSCSLIYLSLPSLPKSKPMFLSIMARYHHQSFLIKNLCGPLVQIILFKHLGCTPRWWTMN